MLAAFEGAKSSLSNQDLAKRTGLPKPTVSRLTYTLCELGYLVADQGGGYRLGPGVLTLGFGVLSGLDMGVRAEEELRQMQNGPNPYVTFGLAERHLNEIVYVAVVQSKQSVVLSAHIGAHLPLFLTAGGQAILTTYDDAELEAAFSLLERDYPKKVDLARRSMARAQKDMDTLGFCRSYNLWSNDVNGIAVPVRSLCGQRVFALNAGGPSFLVPAEQLEQDYAPMMIEAAHRLNPQTSVNGKAKS